MAQLLANGGKRNTPIPLHHLEPHGLVNIPVGTGLLPVLFQMAEIVLEELSLPLYLAAFKFVILDQPIDIAEVFLEA